MTFFMFASLFLLGYIALSILDIRVYMQQMLEIAEEKQHEDE